VDLNKVRQKRTAYAVVIALVGLIALAAIVFFTAVDQALAAERLNATTYALLVETLAALACATVVGRGVIGIIGWIGLAVCVAAFGFLMAFYWTDYHEFPISEGLYKTSQTLLSVSLGYAVATLLVSGGDIRSKPSMTPLTRVTLAATVGVVTLVSVATVARINDTLYWRVAAIVAVLWAFGVFLVTVLHRIPRAVGRPG
jgi:hypothetical protein